MLMIPKPRKVEIKSCGALDLRELKSLCVCGEFKEIPPVIDQTLFAKIHAAPEINGKSGPAMRILFDAGVKPEGYFMRISEDGVEIRAADKNGALYAVQTLRTAAKADSEKPLYKVEFSEIEDYPDHAWRGLLLDAARHFWDADYIKKIIDILLLHKMNSLHLHLTDDQGWRIEIKSFPLLTEIGSKRGRTHIGGWANKRDLDDGKPHSGFYTQEEMRGIVEYAGLRGVAVIPEIDMPAHFAAAFAAYGHLACRDKKIEVPWYFGGHYPSSRGEKDWNRSVCVGKKTTFDFIFAVIDEIAELFSAPYIHIGGDEAPKGEWEVCPDCQRLMKEKGLADTKELQSYFVRTVCDYVKSKGKKPIGWNEVLQGGNSDTDMLVQYWTIQNDKNVAAFLGKGGKALMTKHKPLYIDMPYSKYSLKSVYNFKTYAGGVSESFAGRVVGVETALWTEWVGSVEKLEFQLFPRLTAVAEVCWSRQRDDYRTEFLPRLREFKEIYDGLGVNYARPKIADPKNPIKRLSVLRDFLFKDTEREFNENERIKNM
ncbi:MAG: beta-N-acetylhexosaminidase [Clostridiales bacterium]|jgi:hexosaminidase|nr:beta-N-acetylhexosaminidase [Clostridiales bacterium]